MKSSIHNRMLVALALTCIIPTLRAQIVADGTTNTLSNVITNITGDVTVGTNGSFTLLVLSDNALLTNSANGVIGRNAAAKSNEVRLASATARWLVGGFLFVGSNGAANQLVVSNGAFVNNNSSGFLGNRSDSSNNFALVTGGGSLWSNRLDLTVGSQGRGNQLIVSNGGWVANRNGSLGNNASASNNFALVTGSGSVWSNTSTLDVGSSGPGNRLVIEAGGLAHCDGGYVGHFLSASNNEALVTGPGSLWTNFSFLTIGLSGGFNRLVVSNGAAVKSGTGAMGSFSNQVVVTGIGSVWSNQTFLFVGGASNRVEVSDGGWLACNDGSIGPSFGANSNTVVLTGSGSGWNNLASLIVGDGGNGNVLIASNGATVLSSNATLGVDGSTANNNLAVITGAGTQWSNRNDLVVGSFGVGNRLQVDNSATVLSGNLFLGFNSLSANNRVVVDGGTLRVTNAAGTGVLDVRRGTNVLNAGLIGVDQLLITNSAGRFAFNAGTLSTRSSKISNGQLFRVGNGVSPAMFVLAGNGSHMFADGLSVSANAALTGSGTVGGALVTVSSGGTLAPGGSIGKIVLSNTPSLQGNLRMEISRNGGVLTNDQIEARGVLALLTIIYGGTLTVSNLGPTALTAGDRFQLFNAADYLGSFLEITLPPLNPGIRWLNNLLVDGSIEVESFAPSVQTLPATGVINASATLNGVANPKTNATSAWFEYGFTTNYGTATAPQPLGSGEGNVNFSQALAGLFGGVTYHFRAVASNSFGVVFGTDQSFRPFPAFTDIGAGLPGVDGSQVDFFHSSGFAAWGDYDNDGLLDILLAGRGIIQVWRNTGAGFINNGATQSLPLWGCSAAWGDLDNDGRLDFVVTGREDISSAVVAVVRRNTGTGFIEVNTNNNAPLLGVHAGAAILGDYDNDGLLEVLMTGHNGLGASTEVWRNIGNGWLSINAGLTPAADSAAAWGDYDNDGRLDIMLNAAGAGIWRNTGSGFTNAGVLGGVPNGSVAWGDYDNDGRLDMLLTGGSSHTVGIALVLRNTGNGFTNINAGLPAVYRSAAAWGDYDNDGRLDILLTGTTNINALGSIAQVWRNTGNGFTNINLDLPGVSRSSPIWGDYDNDGRLDILIAGVDRNIERITQVWRNRTPVSNTPPTAPTGLATTVSGGEIILSWNAASDAQTPAVGLTYNVRIGTTPGGSDVMSPMASATGLRRLPQMGNANGRLFAVFPAELGTPYYWSVQAIDTAFAGGPFSSESGFKVLQLPQPVPVLVPATATNLLNGDLNGDGVVDENELQILLTDYFVSSPFLQMTNVAGLGGTNVTFALSNSLAGAFSVEYTTNFVDWYFLGPATPRYEFTDTNAPALPQRYYRLRWP